MACKTCLIRMGISPTDVPYRSPNLCYSHPSFLLLQLPAKVKSCHDVFLCAQRKIPVEEIEQYPLGHCLPFHRQKTSNVNFGSLARSIHRIDPIYLSSMNLHLCECSCCCLESLTLTLIVMRGHQDRTRLPQPELSTRIIRLQFSPCLCSL